MLSFADVVHLFFDKFSGVHRGGLVREYVFQAWYVKLQSAFQRIEKCNFSVPANRISLV